MYKIEMIPKRSVMNDILEFWIASGREDNTKDGCFIFDNADSAIISNGILMMTVSGTEYYYNVIDFYRIKIVCDEDMQ